MQEVIAKAIAGMLNSEGGHLIIGVADDGTILGIEEDLKTLRKPDADRFQLVLMDINLGKGLSGVETMQQLRYLENYYDTPIVALTAYAMAGDADDFLKRGFSHYLAKPFTKMELCELVDGILISE